MTPPTAAGTLLPGFVGTELPDWLARRLRDGLAGVCLFGDNIESPDQVRALTDAVYACNPHALIALDEEGGDVTRLHYRTGSPQPGNAWLGRHDDVELTRAAGAAIAAEVLAVGCNLNFAPSADVNANAANPVIGVRSFGADPSLVARHTAAWVDGHQGAGAAVSVKHFPGHGDTDTDSHLALPVVDLSRAELAARDLVPFAAAVDAGAWTVMTSHILLPQVDASQPATFSATVLQTMLRDELGFDGVIVSDALDMAGASGSIGIPAAAVRALAAGCDLLCIGTENTDDQLADIEAEIAAALEDGRLSAERVDDAAARVAALGADLAARRASVPRPAGAARLDADLVASAFEVNDRARALLAEVAGAAFWVVVQLETAPNIAAGIAPWGVTAALADADGWAIKHRAAVVVSVSEAEAGGLADQLGEVPLLVVGRALHRHAWIRDLVDSLRATRRQVLCVELGWPGDDRAYADIVTWGASPLLAAALLRLLDEGRAR